MTDKSYKEKKKDIHASATTGIFCDSCKKKQKGYIYKYCIRYWLNRIEQLALTEGKRQAREEIEKEILAICHRYKKNYRKTLKCFCK